MIINQVISSLMGIIATIDTGKEESNQLRLFITEYISKDKQS